MKGGWAIDIVGGDAATDMAAIDMAAIHIVGSDVAGVAS